MEVSTIQRAFVPAGLPQLNTSCTPFHSGWIGEWIDGGSLAPQMGALGSILKGTQ